MWSVLSWGFYKAFTNYVEGALVRIDKRDPFEEAKKLAHARAGFVISIILLAGFLALVVIIHGNPLLMLERTLLAPVSQYLTPGYTIPPTYMDRVYYYTNLLSSTLVKYMYNYVEQVGQTYLNLMNMIKYLINILWG